jgi:outer membrane immunogenic protein
MRLGAIAGAASLLLLGPTMPVDAQLISSDQWNGFYAGINTGGVALGASGPLNRTECSTTVGGCSPTAAGGSQGSSQSFKPSGLIGGAQAGYNWQVSPKWTVGIETDFDGVRASH